MFSSARAVALNALTPEFHVHGFTEEDHQPPKPLLEAADVVWLGGGNTSMLLRSLRASGACCAPGYWLYRLLEEGVVLVGVSAGSLVTGSSVQTMFWKGRMRVRARFVVARFVMAP